MSCIGCTSTHKPPDPALEAAKENAQHDAIKDKQAKAIIREGNTYRIIPADTAFAEIGKYDVVFFVSAIT